MIVPELHVHQAGHALTGIGIVVIGDALHQGGRTVAHPDDRDTDALLARWRETLFGADGALNDRAAA